MANKGGIVTIFVNIIPAAAQADMTLNRALSKWFHWTLHMFIFLSFGILHFVSMDGNNRRLMSSECTWTNPLSIRCAHMCVLSSNIQSWAD